MLNDLLWIYGTKRQYDMQKENGLAGLIGILVVFLIVWQWNNWFYPIFESVGLVSIANNVGLITGSAIHTTINVLGLIIGLIVIFFVLVAIPTFFILLIMNLFGSNFNSNRPTPLQYTFSLLLLPLMLVFYPIVKLLKVLKIISPTSVESYKELNKDIVSETSSIEDSYTAVFISQEQKADTSAKRTLISKEEAISILNRSIASLEDTNDYVFAIQPLIRHGIY